MEKTDTLTITLPSPREVMMTRFFDAPRQLVFQAFMSPELLVRWYGPDGWELVVCQIDPRVGGAWRFVSRRPDGREVGQYGVYHEVTPPERIVQTEAWEDWNPGECLVTTTFDERDGGTLLTSTILFPSEEVRDIILKSGLEGSVGRSYEKLAGLLATEISGSEG